MSLAAAPHDAFAACPAADTAARAALTAQQQLQRVSKTSVSEDDGIVPPPVQKALHAFKDALVQSIDAQLACADEAADAPTLERTLNASLGVKANASASAQQSAAQNTSPYGGDFTVDVRRDTGGDHHDPAVAPLLVVRAGFGIPCGDDNLLLGYTWDSAKAHWARALTWQSPDYSEVSGAYGDGFSYLRLAGGQFVLMHGTPWCTSRWSGFTLDVVAPRQASAPQRTIFHMTHGYARGDVDATPKLRPDGFELRPEVRAFDADLMTRIGIFRYRVDGDTVTRVQPAANNGRDFVDEWLQVDEATAREWSDPAAVAQLMPARAQLKSIDKAGVPFNYGGVRACTGDAKRYEVELDANADSGKPVEGGSRRFVGIRQERNGFTALSMHNAADPRCHGPDLMATHK